MGDIMYNKYPFSIVIIYYEAPTASVLVKKLENIRNIVHENNNYFVNRHTNICMIANAKNVDMAKEIRVIPSRDSCFSSIVYSCGYTSAYLIDLVINQQLTNIKHMKSISGCYVHLLPIYIIAIQDKDDTDKVNERMFGTYRKYLKIYNFAISYTVRNTHSDEGGIEQLRHFIKKILDGTISKIIADSINNLQEDVQLEQQAFFSLE